MCAHYHSVTDPAQLRRYFDVDWPPEAAKDDVWPGYSSVFIRRHPHADVGDDAVPNREALVGRFGESCSSIVMDLISSACVYLSVE